MLTYRVRQRVIRLAAELPAPQYPVQATIRFHLQPLQPFGMKADGGRTAVQNVAGSALFNANTGQHTVESAQPLTPLDVTVEAPGQELAIKGAVFSVTQIVASPDALGDLIEGLYFTLPMLLAIDLGDPPYVERVEGLLGSIPFRWELAEWSESFTITSQEQQELHVASAFARLRELSVAGRRRLLAGLHYLHVARRLLAVSATPGEFLGEALLNYAKALDALFPPSAGVGTRDAARTGLTQLGYTDAEIEARFVPAVLLRDNVDVGHVDLTIFTVQQLATLHEYARRAERHFMDLFRRVFEGIAAGTFIPAVSEPSKATAEDIAAIDRLASNMASDSAA